MILHLYVFLHRDCKLLAGRDNFFFFFYKVFCRCDYKIHKCSGSGKVPPGTCTLVSRVTGTKKSGWRSAPKGALGGLIRGKGVTAQRIHSEAGGCTWLRARTSLSREQGHLLRARRVNRCAGVRASPPGPGSGRGGEDTGQVSRGG